MHTLYGVIVASTVLPTASPSKRDQVVSKWSKDLLDIFNIEVRIVGTAPNWNVVGTMFIANHISWIDIHALNSVRTVRFIAKSEIRSWPIFGWFAEKANTLFIDREKKQDASRIVQTVHQSLLAGDCMCYFPEGTTTDGTTLKAFKGSVIQAAIDANAPILPFAIRYPNVDGSPCIEMAFAGETTLLESIWAIVCIANPVVELTFLPAQQTAGRDRRSLSSEIRNMIKEKLNLVDAD